MESRRRKLRLLVTMKAISLVYVLCMVAKTTSFYIPFTASIKLGGIRVSVAMTTSTGEGPNTVKLA